MRRLAILIGLLIVVPMAAGAQESNRSGGRLISPSVPPPQVTIPLAGSTEVLPNVPSGRAETPSPALERSGGQSSVAVVIPPTAHTAIEPVTAISVPRGGLNADLSMILFASGMAGFGLALLAAIVTMIATARRQSRAYIFVAGAEIVDLEKGSVPVVRLDIKNAGQTPAYKLSHVWRCGTFGYPLSERLLLPREGDGMACAHLGPGAVATVSKSAETPRANGANGELTNRAVAFYVYGEIVYKDAFQQRRFTRYVFFQPGLPRLGRGPLLVHDRGNEAS